MNVRIWFLMVLMAGGLLLAGCATGELDERLPDEWKFRYHPGFRLVFYEDGAGRRNWQTASEVFETYRWATNDETLRITRDNPARNERRIERWTYNFTNNENTLTIRSQDEGDIIYTYDRIIQTQALIGRWEYSNAPSFFMEFDANGRIRRNWDWEIVDEFDWRTAYGGRLSIINDRPFATGFYFERWTYTLSDNNNTLTIRELDVPGVLFVYHRAQ